MCENTYDSDLITASNNVNYIIYTLFSPWQLQTQKQYVMAI